MTAIKVFLIPIFDLSHKRELETITKKKVDGTTQIIPWGEYSKHLKAYIILLPCFPAFHNVNNHNGVATVTNTVATIFGLFG